MKTNDSVCNGRLPGMVAKELRSAISEAMSNVNKKELIIAVASSLEVSRCEKKVA